MYEELTADLLDRTIDVVRRTLATAATKSIRAQDISDVLLVGGATLMPSVQRRLTKEFGWSCRRVDPHLAVVKGAAIYAEGLRGEATGEVVREMPKVRKVLPRSFGVRLDRETSLHREHLYIEYIANANDPLPIAQAPAGRLHQDRQCGDAELPLLRAERRRSVAGDRAEPGGHPARRVRLPRIAQAGARVLRSPSW